MIESQPRVSASAPGKLILSGEYAVLDGAPAICMAVDRRARVTISARDGGHHTVTAPGFTDVTGEFSDRNGDPDWVAGRDEFRLVDDVWRTAVAAYPGSVAIALDTSDFRDAAGGAKIGIGSSAALTVALTAALCELAETAADRTSIAYAAHRRFQGGLGSGADIATCSAGGLVAYSLPGGDVQRCAWPDGLEYALLWSGVAASTGSKLLQLGRKQPQPSRPALVASAQRVAKAWFSGSVDVILGEYRDYTRALLEFSIDHELGIFDAGHAGLSAAADTAGVIYKPCGAGGGDIGIVLSSDKAAIEAFVSDAVAQDFRTLNMNVDWHGLQVDREEH